MGSWKEPLIFSHLFCLNCHPSSHLLPVDVFGMRLGIIRGSRLGDGVGGVRQVGICGCEITMERQYL